MQPWWLPSAPEASVSLYNLQIKHPPGAWPSIGVPEWKLWLGIGRRTLVSTNPHLGLWKGTPLLTPPPKGRHYQRITGDRASLKGRSGGIRKETLPNKTLWTGGSLEMKGPQNNLFQKETLRPRPLKGHAQHPSYRPLPMPTHPDGPFLVQGRASRLLLPMSVLETWSQPRDWPWDCVIRGSFGRWAK